MVNKITLSINEAMKHIETVCENILEENNLNYGNAEFVDYGNNEYNFIIEAPNHSTICVDVEPVSEHIQEKFDNSKTLTFETSLDKEDFMKDEIEELIKKEVEEAVRLFDPEEYFEEIWHPGFSIGVFQFVQMLQEDQEFFDNISL